MFYELLPAISPPKLSRLRGKYTKLLNLFYFLRRLLKLSTKNVIWRVAYKRDVANWPQKT